MATKTFKIGESCQGGVITAVATKTKVTIIGKEWDMSQGTSKGSNQSNAEEFTRLEVETNDSEAYRKLSMFLHELTTSYFTDQVLEWVQTKTEFKKSFFW